MAITNSDVKILASERLSDTPDGGGRATGQAIIDEVMNNVFKDISRLDRTTGRISLRKLFAGIVTQTNDAYLGAHAILTEPPEDPRVAVLLFNTGSQTDTRTEAEDLIESYMAPASAASWDLLGNQLTGQRAIIGVQREEQTIPQVGEVFQLVKAGTSQFVRITNLESTIESYAYAYSNDNWVTFTRRRLVLSLSSPLVATFPGGEPTPKGTSSTSPSSGEPKAIVLSTQEADAARYYGISPLAKAVAAGDLSVKVGSIYSQLVPSTSRENALSALLAGYEKALTAAAGPERTVQLIASALTAGESRTFLGSGCAAGSLTLSANGGVYSDDRAGNLKYVSGTNWISIGRIDYGTGEISMIRTGSAWSGNCSATYKPGAVVLGDAVTDSIPIALGNRGYVYTLNLGQALPRPGTLTVSYMALGKWYDLVDNGRGELEGVGTGSVDFATGAVTFTTSALPDVDSAIIYSYVSAADFALSQQVGPVAANLVRITHLLEEQGIRPTSLVVTFTSGGLTKTLTDNGLGVLQGDGVGSIDYAAGEVKLQLTLTPDANTGISYTYEQGETLDSLLTGQSADGSGMTTFTIQGAPLKPGSVALELAISRRVGYPAVYKHDTLRAEAYTIGQASVVRIVDNGSGGWVGRLGTINYTTGQCWVQVERDYSYNTYDYSQENPRAFALLTQGN